MQNNLFFLLLFFSTTLFGQERYYTSPVKIPLFLSGNFAELRSNHFHSGIDIKTQGAIGVPVYSVADGYIARISISPTGFGNALYVNHPNGTTSVYGHLNNFRPDIQEFTKNKQYEKESFRVEIQLPPDAFPLKQGEFIANSGNAGSSGGPHLHFEIRDTKSEEPLNPLKFNFPITDTIPPRIFSMLVAPLSKDAHVNFKHAKKSYPVIFYNGEYHIKNNPIIPVYGKIGFAVQANDYLNGSWNKCGIYSLELKIDGELCFASQLNRFSFDQTRYVNSHFDYAEYIASHRKYQKSWLDPGNRLPIYQHLQNRGILNATDGKNHQIQFILKDAYGNTSKLQFSVKSKLFKVVAPPVDFVKEFKYNSYNTFKNDEVSIEVPAGVLYKNILFQYKKTDSDNDFFSALHVVHKNSVPLQKSATLKIKPIGLSKILQSKALLVSVDTISGKYYSAGGYFENGRVVSQIRNFGNFAVAVDTIPPSIVPLSIKNKRTLTESKQIRFKIKDTLSGINKFEGILDGRWALFEYNAKNNLLTHRFDSKRFTFKKQHQLKLIVTDNKNNETTYEASFYK
ncbi:MAG: M23 family metallopeptidase [Prolixibacteraceae bacterium]|nr:M23 family metallopeptidase [Prolixibacteraceae bacterium]